MTQFASQKGAYFEKTEKIRAHAARYAYPSALEHSKLHAARTFR
jgi:hypothetical protein